MKRLIKFQHENSTLILCAYYFFFGYILGGIDHRRPWLTTLLFAVALVWLVFWIIVDKKGRS